MCTPERRTLGAKPPQVHAIFAYYFRHGCCTHQWTQRRSSTPFSFLIPKHTVIRKKNASHRAQGETPTICLALGTNREGKERVKGKASRVQSSRIGSAGSALVCVRRNVEHWELNLPKSTQFSLITSVMVAVLTSGPNAGLVRPSPLSS